MRAWLAVLLGAVLMLWPALVNRYPIVFSDTAGLGEMGLLPTIGWDKPWVYGPLIVLLHAGITLWGPAVAQCLLVSAMLWLTGRVLGMAAPWRHVAICAVLAVGSAVPWFASFIMPDLFAPLTVLALFTLAWGNQVAKERGAVILSAPVRAAAGAVAAVAIASHLTHLIIAAACLAAILVTKPRRVVVCALPLGAALVWLLACNAVGNAVLAVSPYGSVFALARLQADGPAADYLHSICPRPGYHFCAWSDRLPMNSDAFLWEPEGPIWGGGSGPTLLAAEAAQVVAATLRFEPLEVLRDATLNTLRQLGQDRVGDTLGDDYIVITVGLLLRTYFPAAEQARLLASRQVAGTLRAVAAPLAPLRLGLLAVGALATLATIPWAWRRWPALAGLAVLVVAGVLANAFATGALSGPHDRYGARMAWLVLLPPLAVLLSWAVPKARPRVKAG